MKTQNKTNRTQSNKPVKPILNLPLTIAAAVALTCLVPSGKAGNVLQNPGFENGGGLANWSVQSSVTWNIQPASAQGKLYHSGANGMWTQGIYTGGNNISYAYQTVACAAGSTFTADAFFSQYVNHDSAVSEGGDNGTSGLFGTDGAGQEDAWIEVVFMDSGNNTLADYRSVIVDPALESSLVSSGATVTNGADITLAWLDCQVTNQYDPTQITAGADPDSYPSAITNQLSSGQYMVAPPGTAKVQYRISLFQAQYESGATYWDDASLDLVGGPAPSAVGGLSPDGSKFFNYGATNFAFTITSASSGGAPLPTNPTNGVQVLVNGVDQSAKLKFTGTSTAWSVSLPTLTSNKVYNISINVSNSAGLVTSSSVAFDTFSTNDFIVNVEDYDFTNGMFIQNPIPTNGYATNSYWGTAGTLGVDQSAASSVTSGGNTLVPNYPNRADGNVAFQVASDLSLPLYIAQNNPAVYPVNLSYNNAGLWENYTRNPYPQGSYLVYGRISGGNGAGVEYLNIVTNGYGTSTQLTNNLGAFVLANGTSWSSYSWIPLTDSYGNPVVVNLPAGQQTLQLLSGGGENIIDFIFVPFSGGLPPTIGNFNPPVNVASSNTFLGGSNTLSFSVGSPSTTIATTNVQVWLNGVAAPETFTGVNTNWSVSVPLPQNQIVNLIISVTDANGQTKSVTNNFDTFTQNNFMVEAEDFDFNSGEFIDNPVPTGNANVALASLATNSYYYYPGNDSANIAIQGVDYTDFQANNGELYNYRPLDSAGTDVATDYVRSKFVAGGQTNSDYYVGWWNPGTWLNYTRTYPAGTYKVYGRLAGGAAYSGLTLSVVTNGYGTATQQTNVLGTFSDPTANGWQNWHWVPLLGTNGQPALVTLGGVETLKATAGTGQNANYYMFVSVGTQLKLSASVNQGKIVIQIPTQNGTSYTVLYNNNLTGGTWTPLGSSIPGTGSTVLVTNTITQAQQFYKVMAQ
jgi:hypothetical protein